MSSRSIWKGTLSLGLVNIPVSLYIAIDKPNDGLEFHQLHNKCKGRITRPSICPACNVPVPATDIIKGFPSGADHIIVSDAELEALKPESDKTISVKQFVSVEEIPAEYYDDAWYLLPSELVGMNAYAVLREGMIEKDVAALGCLTYHGHESLVAIRACDDKALIAYRLREHTQFRAVDTMKHYDAIPAGAAKAEAQMMGNIIDSMLDEFNPKAFEDSMRKGLRDLLDKKLKGEVITTPSAVASPKQNAINVMDALKNTLALSSKKPAKKAAAQKNVVPAIAKSRKEQQKRAHA